ncbi:MAG TPA: hypothetical protein VHY36_13395 [Steroidobacteraceae bacterium]|jgi:hypothetical protein|nr:hypothetical protein [Steroidobacteraceae bacterium]
MPTIVVPRYLFKDVPIVQRFDKMMRHAGTVIDGMDDDEILSCDVTATTEDLLRQYRIEFPTLGSTNMEQPVLIKESRGGSQTIAAPSQYSFTIVIPFEGEPAIFKTQPGAFPCSAPIGAIHQSEIRFTLVELSPESNIIRSKVDRNILGIRKYLEVLRSDWDRAFDRLSKEINKALMTRRDELHRAGLVGQELGYPLRRRDDPSGMAVPVTRKSILPAMPPSVARPVAREPYIEDSIYREILNVLASMSLLIERNHTTFENIEEPVLRDHFLLQLNGQFEGKATGETFNGNGKTDILLRDGDKNLFIAECKFWTGQKSLMDAIDQLLGYATWRDSKAAILVFSRRKDFSRTVEDAGRTLQQHRQFRQLRDSERDTSFRAWIARPDDEQRRIDLTVMLFNIPQTSAIADQGSSS